MRAQGLFHAWRLCESLNGRPWHRELQTLEWHYVPLVHALLCFLVRMPCLLATAWAWLTTLACKSHARWLEQGEKIGLRDLAAKAQRQQQRNKSKKSIKLSVVGHSRQPTDKKNSSICLKKVCSSSRNTITC